MKNNINTLISNPIFDGINIEDTNSMLKCLSAFSKTYSKGDIILLAGSSINNVGIILNGSAQVIKEDENGRQNIISEIKPTELFAEVFACANLSYSPVTVISTHQNTEVLFINYKKIISSCSSACVFHNKLIENMLKVVATKNIMLNNKIDILSKRTIREKTLALLKHYSNGSNIAILPFNREQMAAYLCVDRSALSTELKKLEQEGVIKFNKNYFELT